MPGLSKQSNPAMERFFSSRDTSWADKAGGVVPFYPSRRYIEKNLAPELDISRQQLEALAEANILARRQGLMPAKIADKMLPTLLTESASGISSWGYPDSPRYRTILEKAGLPPTIDEVNAMKSTSDYDRELRKAKLMHAVMAAKVADYGEDLAVERWNGKGTGMGGMANAANHAKKVAELEQMLRHPKNQPMMDAWNEYSDRYSKGPVQAAKSLGEYIPNIGDPELLWQIKDKLGVDGSFADAAGTALGNTIGSIQRSVRNWTAPSAFVDRQVVEESLWKKARDAVEQAFSK